MSCPICGCTDLTDELQEEKVLYGEDAICAAKVMVTVLRCGKCGQQWTECLGEIQEAAIQGYLQGSGRSDEAKARRKQIKNKGEQK